MKDSTIRMAHGGGGRAARDLIQREIASRFTHEATRGLPDGAVLKAPRNDLVFTTDSFVVQPLFFSGGDIGHLAVFGTVNDLAVMGAVPRWLSLAMIVEEGFDIATLQRVLDSVSEATEACDVHIVTGDSKVVPKGQCDGIYLNTAGIGERIPAYQLNKASIGAGDAVLVSGCLGQHGMAVMAAREELGFKSTIQSDAASVAALVRDAVPMAHGVRFMRDPTRGGLAAVLHEIAEGSSWGIQLEESALPFDAAARSLAEILGLDLLHVACEGCIVAVVDAQCADRVLDCWRQRPEGRYACRIGTILDEPGKVWLRTAVGGRRLVDAPDGELLPRIC